MWLRFNPARDALFLDVDGTLLDIAPTALEVVVSKQLIEDLQCLNRKLKGALAFVSGRMIHEIDELFAPLRLRCSGAHGAEWRLSPDGPVKTSRLLPHELRDRIAASFQGVDGVYVEDKMYTIAVHYRQSPSKAEAIEQKLSALIEKHKNKIKIMHGRKVFEVSSINQSKGEALKRLLATPCFKKRRPVFLGDDVTDISAIGACLKNGGIAARVGRGDPRQKSAFASPEQVRKWVHALVTESG